jgi:hypothetical protein
LKQYSLINNIAGWLVFAIAAFVYVSTIEPTASWWDCGEYISASYKLMVGHEPGAPMFQMIARLFSLLAGNDVTQVAKWVNTMSALASAFTILFLFWSITAFARKMIFKGGEITTPGIIAVIGSGVVGALAYTFSDSFWFSAVEGEVYAMSSFFTAIVFWAILKWESVADKPHADRWIILIALLMGMSIGVHLLNLLAIPALVIVYYFKKYDFSIQGFIAALGASVLILVGVQYGVIPGVVKLASIFELLFVNSFGLPFNTGVVFYFILLVSAIAFGTWYTQKHQKHVANTIILALTFLLIGYSAYFQSVIRSNANPPMDESNPDNVFALISYLNREQYGDRPLFKGQYFTAKMTKTEKGGKVWHKGKDKYEVVEEKTIPVYDSRNSGLFPRMYSPQAHHVTEYKNWSGTDGKKKPTSSENLTFFVKYQLGHMYFRYFMWNFAGRQNDVQSNGAEGTGASELLNGNWISGIPFIDEARLGPQDNLPVSITGNKAYNKFYMIPFLLGIIGLIGHFMKDKKDFFVVLLLFVLTGVAVVVYLNQYPYQPRERDYAYVGSFYAFAIWIGLSVAAIYDWLSGKAPAIAAAGVGVALGLSAPYLMEKEGWNDHDRSNRFAARDLAANYLKSCAPNAIIFTNGDNDTFPLWYAQEVEGIRTDVRVVNLSLFNTSWYIDQLRRRAYESAPLPFSIKEDKLLGDRRLQIPLVDRKIEGYVDLKKIIDFVSRDEKEYTVPTGAGDMNYIPTQKFRIPVDSATVVNNGTVPAAQAKDIVKAIEWQVEENFITRNHLMMLDILANNNWERPIYFAVTVGDELYLNLQDYFRVEGFAYRLVPIKNTPKDGQAGTVDADKMYESMVNKFAWGNMNDSCVYQGTETSRMSMNYRNMFARLAFSLFEEGKKEQAVQTLDKCLEQIPASSIELNFAALPLMEAYYRAGENEKANKLAERIGKVYGREMDYFISLPLEFALRTGKEPRIAFSVLQRVVSITAMYKQTELSERLKKMFEEKKERFVNSPAAKSIK